MSRSYAEENQPIKRADHWYAAIDGEQIGGHIDIFTTANEAAAFSAGYGLGLDRGWLEAESEIDEAEEQLQKVRGFCERALKLYAACQCSEEPPPDPGWVTLIRRATGELD